MRILDSKRLSERAKTDPFGGDEACLLQEGPVLVSASFPIPGDPLKELSPNVNPAGSFRNPRGSMMKKNRLRSKWKRIAWEAWEEAGSPRFFQPIEIEFRIYRGRTLDPDNALAGLKNLIDGLTTRRMQRSGMIPDDSARWVRWLPIQFVTGKSQQGVERVWVRIRLQEEATALKISPPKEKCVELG